MLSIRLSRVGKKNKPTYRLVIMEKARDPYGHALEILGSYNPHSKELQTKADRINYWLKNGAKMSPTVNNLLIEQGIIKGEKIKASIARKSKKAVEEPTAQAQAPAKSEEKPSETEAPKEESQPVVETVAEEKPKENAPADESK